MFVLYILCIFRIFSTISPFCPGQGNDPTAISVLTQAITGQVGFMDAEFCTTCGEKGAEKRCSICKMVGTMRFSMVTHINTIKRYIHISTVVIHRPAIAMVNLSLCILASDAWASLLTQHMQRFCVPIGDLLCPSLPENALVHP